MTNRVLTGNAVGGTVATATDRALTLYVRTDGNDNNTGLVDSAGGALLTVQAALDKVPKYVQHLVTINVGAGTFPGWIMTGFTLDGRKNVVGLTVRGADYINFTPATGTGSGTATGGSTSQLVDVGQAWTVNNLRGKLIYVNSEYLIIRSNTADTINTVGISGSTMSGKAYVIKDWSTIFNTSQPNTPYGAVVGCVNNILYRNNSFFDRFKVEASAGATVALLLYNGGMPKCTYISVDGKGVGTIGIDAYLGLQVWLENIVATGSTVGIAVLRGQETATAKNLFGYSNSLYGISLESMPYAYSMSYCYGDNNTRSGIRLYNCGRTPFDGITGADYNGYAGLEIDSSSWTLVSGGIFNNNNTGIDISGHYLHTGGYPNRVESSQAVSLTGTFVCSNNTLAGLRISDLSQVSVTALTGTGNGTYGIQAERGARVILTSATTVTGTSGNMTIDEGSTILTYATDFAVDGDSVINAADGTTAKRLDTLP